MAILRDKKFAIFIHVAIFIFSIELHRVSFFIQLKSKHMNKIISKFSFFCLLIIVADNCVDSSGKDVLAHNLNIGDKAFTWGSTNIGVSKAHIPTKKMRLTHSHDFLFAKRICNFSLHQWLPSSTCRASLHLANSLSNVQSRPGRSTNEFRRFSSMDSYRVVSHHIALLSICRVLFSFCLIRLISRSTIE